jgi:hypothetical protein
MKEAERLRQTRAIRTRIARLRRNLDSDTQAARREGRNLASWKTLARRFPGSALLVAFGTGLALSAGFSGRWFAAWFGRRLASRATRRIQARVFDEAAGFVQSLFARDSDEALEKKQTGADRVREAADEA